MVGRLKGQSPDPRRLKQKLQLVASQRPTPEPVVALEPYVFLAYAREDQTIAETLVAALRARGIAVTWDQDLVAGQNFRAHLDAMLERASAVIVIWSENVTDFLVDEAEAGKARNALVPCRTPGLPRGRVPTGFRGLHCIDVDDIGAILKALEARGLAASAPA
jgi:hypothetical protein